MRNASAIVLLCVTVAGSGACGAPAPMPDVTTDRDTGVTDVATADVGTPDVVASDAAAPTDDAAPDAAPTVLRAGFVQVQQYVSGLTQESASFALAPDGNGCTTRTLGVCQSARCPRSGPTSTMVVSAGDLTLASAGGASVTLHAAATNGYFPANQSSPPWAPGATVRVSGAGATVPAFSTSLVYPDHVVLTRPVVDFTYQIAVDRSADMPVVWTPTAHGETLVRLQQQLVDGTLLIECYFPGAAGSGVVPSAALAELGPDATGGATAVEFVGAGRGSVAAGAYTVNTAAELLDVLATAVVR